MWGQCATNPLISILFAFTIFSSLAAFDRLLCSIPLFQQKNFSVIRDRTQVSYDDKCLRTVAIQQTKL